MIRVLINLFASMNPTMKLISTYDFLLLEQKYVFISCSGFGNTFHLATQSLEDSSESLQTPSQKKKNWLQEKSYLYIGKNHQLNEN